MFIISQVISDRVEKGEDAIKVAQELMKAHFKVVFNGNGYDKDWPQTVGTTPFPFCCPALEGPLARSQRAVIRHFNVIVLVACLGPSLMFALGLKSVFAWD